MNLASESLSSPCGYYGEVILQEIRCVAMIEGKLK